MDKVRFAAGILLSPLMLVAIALSGVSAVLAGVWSGITLSKQRRQKAAVEAALATFMKITDQFVVKEEK